MIVSRDPELLARAKHLTTQAKADPDNFIHDEVGYNYRLTNLQAALGLAQLEQLEAFIETKGRNYALYREWLSGVPGCTLLPFREGIRSNYWFYSLYVEAPYPKDPAALIQHLRAQEIQSRPIWGLIHEQVPYREALAYRIERASAYWSHVVNLPCSTNLTAEDVERVVKTVRMGT